MRTFDFVISVTFFHGKPSKIATLENFTFQEAFSVFNDLKLKYANDSFPFHDIEMTTCFGKAIKTVAFICSDFLHNVDQPF